MAKKSKDCVRVLLAASSPSDVRMFCRSLQEYRLRPFEVESAGCLAEAISLAAKGRFDAAVLDPDLPDSHGLETCMKMRQAAPDVPIVVLAGTDEEPVALKAIQRGVQDYVVKGRTHDGNLGRAVHYAVERRRAQRTLQDAQERLQAQTEELRAQQEELQSQAQELRQTEQALRRLNEELEDRVAARTADLSKANDALRQAGDYHRSLIEASLDPLVTIGPDGKITDVNAATEAATGRTRKRLIGTDFANYFTEPAKARAGYQQVFQEGFVRDYPLEIRHKTGRVAPVLYNATMYRDEAGNTVGVFAAARDVTELRRAEQAVRAERRRFNDVLETLPAYLVLLTPDHHVPLANRFFRERFGESHGKRCFEYLFSRTEPCERCETYTVLKTHKPHRWEWTGPDGRNYDIYDFPFTDTDGSTLIMEMGIDITERKHAEVELAKHRDHLEELVRERTSQLEAANAQLQAQAEELAAQARALRESESRLKLAQQSAGAGVWDRDMSTGKLDWSAELFRLFGLDPSGPDATFDLWRSVLHPEDRPVVETRIEQAIQNHTPLRSEYRIVRPRSCMTTSSRFWRRRSSTSAS